MLYIDSCAAYWARERVQPFLGRFGSTHTRTNYDHAVAGKHLLAKKVKRCQHTISN